MFVVHSLGSIELILIIQLYLFSSKLGPGVVLYTRSVSGSRFITLVVAMTLSQMMYRLVIFLQPFPVTGVIPNALTRFI